MTRIRFFGVTYLWDTKENIIYTDDIKNGKRVGVMNNSKNGIMFD